MIKNTIIKKNNKFEIRSNPSHISTNYDFDCTIDNKLTNQYDAIYIGEFSARCVNTKNMRIPTKVIMTIYNDISEYEDIQIESEDIIINQFGIISAVFDKAFTRPYIHMLENSLIRIIIAIICIKDNQYDNYKDGELTDIIINGSYHKI
jgi:hypothetical protein